MKHCVATVLFFAASYFSFAAPADSLTIENYLQTQNIKAEKSPDGVYFSVVAQGNGALPQSGEYLQIQFTTSLLDGKVVDSSNTITPFIFQLGYRHVIPVWDNMLSQFKAGSTILLFVPPQLAYGNSGYNGVVPPNAPVIFQIKIEKILSLADYEATMRAAEDIERADFKKREIAIFESDNKAIDDFVVKNKLKVEKTKSGARVITTKQGSCSKISAGQKVSVLYEGSLLNGTVFDSKISSEPFVFTAGANKVILGWEESMALLKNKAEATLILPARLGYGATPLDDGKIIIPGNSVLVFKIKIVDVQ